MKLTNTLNLCKRSDPHLDFHTSIAWLKQDKKHNLQEHPLATAVPQKFSPLSSNPYRGDALK